MATMYSLGDVNVLPESIIWRYYDLPKFLSLLASSSVYFCRIDKLQDSSEGRVTIIPPDYAWVKEKDSKSIEICPPNPLRSEVFVNCWYHNKDESYAMWKLYLQGKDGVAIKTSIDFFKQSINDSNLTERKIDYIRYDTGAIYHRDKDDDLTNFDRLFYKDSSFSHENEYRFALDSRNFEESNSKSYVGNKVGINCKVDLNLLIKEIYLAPHMGQWQKNLIKDLLCKYSLSSIPIKVSKLNYNLYELPKAERGKKELLV